MYIYVSVCIYVYIRNGLWGVGIAWAPVSSTPPCRFSASNPKESRPEDGTVKTRNRV